MEAMTNFRREDFFFTAQRRPPLGKKRKKITQVNLVKSYWRKKNAVGPLKSSFLIAVQLDN